MNKLLLLSLSILLMSCRSQSQNSKSVSEGNWKAYMAEYEKGAGSTTLNMDLVKNAPNAHLPFVLITGVTFTNCTEDGFPNKDEYDILYQVSDDVLELTSNIVSTEHAGTFTYQCERLDYIYVNDTAGIRSKLSKLYKEKYSNYKYYINIRRDEQWEGYLKFLFPNEAILESMSNQEVIQRLIAGGDDLTKARQVDHWLYFLLEDNRDAFESIMLSNGFKIEGKDKVDNSERPYSLHISRTDHVDPQSINEITVDLKRKAVQQNGAYDGWETFVIKN